MVNKEDVAAAVNEKYKVVLGAFEELKKDEKYKVAISLQDQLFEMENEWNEDQIEKLGEDGIYGSKEYEEFNKIGNDLAVVFSEILRGQTNEFEVVWKVTETMYGECFNLIYKPFKGDIAVRIDNILKKGNYGDLIIGLDHESGDPLDKNGSFYDSFGGFSCLEEESK